MSRLILLSGANPNCRTTYQNNAPVLCVAAKEGFSEMVALLLEFNANVDAVSESGMSALCYAAAAGRIDIMRMLCLRNARVRLRYCSTLCYLKICFDKFINTIRVLLQTQIKTSSIQKKMTNVLIIVLNF